MQARPPRNLLQHQLSLRKAKTTAPSSMITRIAIEEASDARAPGRSRANWERLSMQVAPEFKRKLQNQAKRAGLSLSEWVRIRLEAGAVSPREVRSFLNALVYLGQRIDQIDRDPDRRGNVSTDAEFEAALIDARRGRFRNLEKLLLHKEAVRANRSDPRRQRDSR